MTPRTCACGALAEPEDWDGWGMCGYCIARLRGEIAEQMNEEWWHA